MSILKRKDLAKEFDLIVKQEIKNHNDSILTTNMAIDSLKQAIEKISDKLNEAIARFDSKYLDLYSNVKNMNAVVSELKSCHASHKNDIQKYIDIIDSKIKEFDKDRFNTSSEIKSFVLDFEDSKKSITKSFLLQQSINDEFTHLIRLIKDQIKSEVNAVKKEILSMPSEALQVKEHLDKKLDVAMIDFGGVMKEIRVVKNNSFVTEKHIEDIYTQIERLKVKV